MFAALKNIGFTDRLLRRPPGLYSMAMRQLLAVETSTPAQRQAIQAQRIGATLARARALPGYDNAPASNDLADWPILTKADILGQEDRFSVSSVYPAPHAETGGTTGAPLRIKRSISGIAFEQAVIDYLCTLAGHDARRARAVMLKGDVLGAEHIAAGQYWIDIGDRKRIYSSLHISADKADIYERSLSQYAPDILYCYPSSVDTLVNHLGDCSRVRIPLVFTSSEVLLPDVRERFRAALKCDSIDLYGHAERLVAAYNINGGGYRFLPSYGHVELIPCGDGLARIIATSVRPNGQIFVRYDTGDIARVGAQDAHSLQQISLGLADFDGIVGRDSEYVELPDGRRIFALNQIPRGAKGANSVQLHYNGSDAVDIYVVPGKGFDFATCEHIMRNFHARFAGAVDAWIWTVAAPVREPNGKAPVLLRRPVLPDQRSAVNLTCDLPPMEFEIEPGPADAAASGALAGKEAASDAA